MASRTATVPGNWSDSAVWGGSAPPGAGDTATINVAVVLDADVTVGPSGASGTAAVTVAAAGKLTWGVGVTLRLRGDLIVAGATGDPTANVRLDLVAGSKIVFDHSLAAGGTQYKLQLGTNPLETPLMRVRGTSGNHAVLRTDTTGGTSNAYTPDTGLQGSGSVDAEYLDVSDFGDGSHYCFLPYAGGDDSSYFRMANCTVTRYGPLNQYTWMRGGATFVLDGVKFSAGLGSTSVTTRGFPGLPKTTGTRLINGCAFDKPADLSGSLDFTITGNVFLEGAIHTLTPWAEYSNNFVRVIGNDGPAALADVSDSFYFHDQPGNGNPHGWGIAADQDVTISGMVIECVDGGGGEAFIPGNPASPRVYTLEDILLLPTAGLPDGYGVSAQNLFALAGGANATVRLRHATYPVSDNEESGLQVGETYLGHAGLLDEFFSCVAWRPDAGTGGYKLHRHVSSSVQDIVHAEDADYNWGWNLAAGSATKGYHSYNTTNALFSTGTPGVHDGTGDPDFADSDRNLAKWAVDEMGSVSGTVDGQRADGLAALVADPVPRIAALIAYCRAGFAPQNAALATAAHDGGTIGAVQFVEAFTPGMPARLDIWAVKIKTRHATGSAPYVIGDGEAAMNASEHYDVTRANQRARDVHVKLGIEPQDWDANIEAAIVRSRDGYVLNPEQALESGPQFILRYTTGYRYHWAETGDPLSLQAIEVQSGVGSLALLTSDYRQEKLAREVSYSLKTLLDMLWAGLIDDTDPRFDAAALTLIDMMVEQWAVPEGTRYIRFSKPFMIGLAMRSLIAYWDRFRADAGRSAVIDAIPDAVEAVLGYVWDECFFPPGETAVSPDLSFSWDQGAIKYVVPDTFDPSLAPIEGIDIVSVDAHNKITGPGTLSEIDDYYRYMNLRVDPDFPNLFAYVVGYDGATKQFTLYPDNSTAGVTASMTFDLFLEGAGPGIGVDGVSPGPELNNLVSPGFAWMYWHKKHVQGDEAGSLVFRTRFDAMFDGAFQAWEDTYSQKIWNQDLLWIFEGLCWRERGDEEWTAATTFTLQAPATGAAGPAGEESGPFRVALPATRHLDAPATVTPSASTGRGEFIPASVVVTPDAPLAAFRYVPDALDDGTSVAISATATGLTAPAPVAYAVGEVVAKVILINSPAGGILLLTDTR